MKTEKKVYRPPDKRMHAPSVPLASSSKTSQLKNKAVAVTDNFIDTKISSVSKSNIELWISHLASFHTRHTKSKFIDKVADWLKAEFGKFGYGDVNFHNYDEEGYALKNVVCHKKGRSNKTNLICAHYDSRMKDLNDSEFRAPGADDNASGIAAILETSRILCDVSLEDSVQFVFFSGEEQGLWGSKHYAQYLKDSNVNLHRLINLDMVGYPPSGKPIIVIERDMGNAVAGNDQDSQRFGEVMEQTAVDYTDLQVMLGPIYDSDYMPFEALGYVVAGLYDGGAIDQNTHYHSSTDIPSAVNMDYVVSTTKLLLATILQETRNTPSA
jgi:hypothetical protein